MRCVIGAALMSRSLENLGCHNMLLSFLLTAGFSFIDGYPYNFTNAELYAASTCGAGNHPYASFGPSSANMNMYQSGSWSLPVPGSNFSVISSPPGTCTSSNSSGSHVNSLDNMEINKLVSVSLPHAGTTGVHSNSSASLANMSVHYGSGNMMPTSTSQYDLMSHCSGTTGSFQSLTAASHHGNYHHLQIGGSGGQCSHDGK